MPDHIPFGWFYVLNLCIGSSFLIGYGIKKKYPTATWLTIVGLLMLLFIAGLKLMGHPVQDWPALIRSSPGDPAWSKFVPGGVLFFAVGFVLLKRFLSFRTSVMDALILVLPWMIIVQRIGCFINGCCYGKPTVLPWAVSYPSGTSAFDHYFAAGQIPPGDLITCDLHPAQLYVVFGALIVWVIILLTRKKWKSPGSLALFGMLLLGGMRFTVEFFRETPADRWYSQSLLGINYLQWIILALVAALSLYLIHREKKFNRTVPDLPLLENIPKTLFALLVLILAVWNLRRLFEFQELIILQILMSAALLATLHQLFLMGAVYRSRPVWIAILVIAFITMSQDIIQTEADTLKKDPAKTWFNFTVGATQGKYEYRSRDCDGNITGREQMRQTAGGIDISYNSQPKAFHQFGFGIRSWISDISDISGNVTTTQYTGLSYGINPYANINFQRIGLGLGISVLKEQAYDRSVMAYPSLYLRIGQLDNFFIDAGLFDQMALNGYLAYGHLGIGSGFRSGGKTVLSTGLSFSGFSSELSDATNFYLKGDFRISDRFQIKPGVYLGNQVFGELGLSYNFAYRGKK